MKIPVQVWLWPTTVSKLVTGHLKEPCQNGSKIKISLLFVVGLWAVLHDQFNQQLYIAVSMMNKQSLEISPSVLNMLLSLNN